jgi:Fe-S cluster assembly protein SufD
MAKSQASGVINSKVVVKENIKNVTANQSIDNLLLSKDAVINVKPELEIYSDDVRCSHGATIGDLDEKLLFYLRSRGIEEEKAKIMLVDAFIKSVLSKIKYESIIKYLTNVFSNKLEISK